MAENTNSIYDKANKLINESFTTFIADCNIEELKTAINKFDSLTNYIENNDLKVIFTFYKINDMNNYLTDFNKVLFSESDIQTIELNDNTDYIQFLKCVLFLYIIIYFFNLIENTVTQENIQINYNNLLKLDINQYITQLFQLLKDNELIGNDTKKMYINYTKDEQNNIIINKFIGIFTYISQTEIKEKTITLNYYFL
jgi:hypothetical protein